MDLIDLKIGIVGIRGLPPKYGGYETFCDHFVKHICKSGHEVLVSCEKVRGEKMKEEYHGAKLVYFPINPPKKYMFRKVFEGIYDMYFYLKFARSVDILYVLAGLGTQVLLLSKLLNPKLKIVTNNDGLEWKRSKYNLVEKIMWKSFIRNSLRYSHLVIHDNPALVKYFPKHNIEKTSVISYGVDIIQDVDWSPRDLSEYTKNNNLDLSNLAPFDFYIVVARLQHDNNTHMIVEGYLNSKTERKLIVVGDFQDKKYEAFVRSITKKNKNIFFTGGIYDPKILNMLRTNSYCYLHGHSAGGTNPALLEAMSMSKPVIAHDNEFNRNVLDDSGLFFKDSEELGRHIDYSDLATDKMKMIGKENYLRAQQEYSWSNCFQKHELQFQRILEGQG